MTTYYFDWDNGDDANDGLSTATLFPYRRFIYGRKGLLDRKISRYDNS